MCRSSQVVASGLDASAGLPTTCQPCSHESDAPNDTPTDMIWSPNVLSYRKEHVHLAPDSTSSSSSLSSSFQHHSQKAFKSNGFGFTQMAEPYSDKDPKVPSFCSVDLRPPAGPRTTSSPAVLYGRPLSLSELIIRRTDEQSEDLLRSKEDDNDSNVHLHHDQDPTEQETSPTQVDLPELQKERSPQPQNLTPRPDPPRIRNRSYSNPGEYHPTPLSSFTDIWR